MTVLRNQREVNESSSMKVHVIAYVLAKAKTYHLYFRQFCYQLNVSRSYCTNAQVCHTEHVPQFGEIF